MMFDEGFRYVKVTLEIEDGKTIEGTIIVPDNIGDEEIQKLAQEKFNTESLKVMNEIVEDQLRKNIEGLPGAKPIGFLNSKEE